MGKLVCLLCFFLSGTQGFSGTEPPMAGQGPCKPVPGHSTQRTPVNYLMLAASCLDSGHERDACEYLGKYLADHPHFLAGRAEYAELLFKLHRLDDARAEFERYVSEAHDAGVKLVQIVHAHGR